MKGCASPCKMVIILNEQQSLQGKKESWVCYILINHTHFIEKIKAFRSHNQIRKYKGKYSKCKTMFFIFVSIVLYIERKVYYLLKTHEGAADQTNYDQ